jgi:hypothetical protein
LDAIFSQAESPHLARMYLIGTFNIYYSQDSNARDKQIAITNAANLARELIRRGIDSSSTEEIVSQKLTNYAFESVNSFGVDIDRFKDQITSIVEAVMDCFEIYLKPLIELELNGSA